MSFFRQQKPRGFQHRYLYIDERKERLKEMERRVKTGMNHADEQQYDAKAYLQGAFRQSSRHLSRQRNNSLVAGLLLVMFVMLTLGLFLWIFI